MNESPSATSGTQLVSIQGLQAAPFWPSDRRPALRTLREWSRTRRIPCIRLGKNAWYDIEAVRNHILKTFTIKAR